MSTMPRLPADPDPFELAPDRERDVDDRGSLDVLPHADHAGIGHGTHIYPGRRTVVGHGRRDDCHADRNRDR